MPGEVVEFSDNADLPAIRAAEPRFDMIVTDLTMPDADGLAMIRDLHSRPAPAGVPIIVPTTASGDDVKAQAEAARATGWPVRPFVPDRTARDGSGLA